MGHAATNLRDPLRGNAKWTMPWPVYVIMPWTTCLSRTTANLH